MVQVSKKTSLFHEWFLAVGPLNFEKSNRKNSYLWNVKFKRVLSGILTQYVRNGLIIFDKLTSEEFGSGNRHKYPV